MGTVTIAASFGAGGRVVGPAVAERLGLPFVDRAIPVQLAQEMNQPLLAATAYARSAQRYAKSRKPDQARAALERSEPARHRTLKQR